MHTRKLYVVYICIVILAASYFSSTDNSILKTVKVFDPFLLCKGTVGFYKVGKEKNTLRH